MTRKLILHIGYGKTGTTAIQEFLINRKDWMQDNGITPIMETKKQ